MSKPTITDEQVMDLMREGWGLKKIKRHYSIGTHRITRLRDQLRRRGLDHEHELAREVPDGWKLKGISDMRTNVEGKPIWYKFDEDKERQHEMMLAAVEAMARETPKVTATPAPKAAFDTDIIPWLQIGDAHIGLACHEGQVNHAFDLEMAERELCAAFADLIDRSPACERFVINDLGDATHYENAGPVAFTYQSGHPLQSAGTYADMIRVYDTCIRFAIDYALRKHRFVDVIINQGNHSRSNDLVMAHMLRIKYEDEPRVTVLDNRCILIPYRMGNTFVVTTHTDKMKPKAAADAVATDYHQDWGEAFYRFIDGGHVHHHNIGKEHPGVIYRSWNQLAPNDKHAFEAGYRSRSFLSLVERSKTYGERGTLTVTAEEIKDRLDGLVPGTTARKRLPVHTV